MSALLELPMKQQSEIAFTTKYPRGRALLLMATIRDHFPSEHLTFGAEIGVDRGETSAALLYHIPNLFLYMVDPWGSVKFSIAYRKSGDERAKRTPEMQEMCLREADELTEFARHRRQICRCTSLDAAENFGNSSIDWAFIDADHTYESVLSDIDAWWPKIRNGGLLCGHDYGHRRDRVGIWGVSRAVNKRFKENGVKVKLPGETIWVVQKH